MTGLRGELESSEQRTSVLDAELKGMQGQVEGLRKELAAAEGRADGLRDDHAAALAIVESLRADLAASQAAFASASDQARTAEARLAQAAARAQAEEAGTRAEMEAGDQAGAAILCQLSEQVRVLQGEVEASELCLAGLQRELDASREQSERATDLLASVQLEAAAQVGPGRV